MSPTSSGRRRRAAHRIAVLAAVAATVAATTTGCTGDPRTPPTTATTSATATATASPSTPPDPLGTPTPATTPDPGAATPTAPPAPTPATVDVVVAWSSYDAASASVQASGYANVVESAGTCTLELTGPGGRTASTTVPALADATTTSCGVMSVPRSQLAAGTWNGTVRYASATSTGAAATTPVEVP